MATSSASLLYKLMGLEVQSTSEDAADTFTLKYYGTEKWQKAIMEMYKEGALCDVTLVSESQEFPCHRLILAAGSDYFRAMFTANFREKLAEKIEMPIGSGFLKHILEYIYLGETQVKKDSIQELFVAAHMLGITQLQQSCTEKLRQHIDNSNCISLYFFASFYNTKDLRDYAKSYACHHLAAVISEKSNVDLTCDQLIELLSFTDMEHKEFSEDVVYDCIWQWLELDWDCRKQYLSQLMCLLKLRHLSEELQERMRHNPKLAHITKLQHNLLQLKYIQDHPNRWHETDLDLESRCDALLSRVYFIEKQHNMQAFCTLRLESACITATAQFIPETLLDIQLVSVERKGETELYLMTGSDRSAVNIFLMDSYCALKRLKSLPSPRKGFTMTSLDRQIYVIGGSCQSKLIRTVWVYNTADNIWNKVSPMFHRLRGSCAISYKGELYVFGGESCLPGPTSEISVSAYAQRYNPEKDSWHELQPMTAPRAWASCALYRDKIYIVGGITRLKGGLECCNVDSKGKRTAVKTATVTGSENIARFWDEAQQIEKMMDATGSDEEKAYGYLSGMLLLEKYNAPETDKATTTHHTMSKEDDLDAEPKGENGTLMGKHKVAEDEVVSCHDAAESDEKAKEYCDDGCDGVGNHLDLQGATAAPLGMDSYESDLPLGGSANASPPVDSVDAETSDLTLDRTEAHYSHITEESEEPNPNVASNKGSADTKRVCPRHACDGPDSLDIVTKCPVCITMPPGPAVLPEAPLSTTEVYDMKKNVWHSGPVLPEGFLVSGVIKHRGMLCAIGNEEIKGQCRRQIYKLNSDGTEWLPFSDKSNTLSNSNYENLSCFSSMKPEEGYQASSFVMSGLKTNRCGSLYIKGEARSWDRRPYLEDFIEDPFDFYGNYGETDDDDFYDYSYYDEDDDDNFFSY